jgi:anaphase-promoting complex subunit 3
MRPAPVKQGPPEEPPLAKALSGPTTGIGFFTPDLTANTTLLRGRKNVPQAFRMDPPLDPRDTM